MSRLPGFLALTVGVAMLACGGGEGEGAASSAAEAPASPDPATVWTLSEEPEFSVSEGTDPDFQLFGASYGAILEDGTLVVANVRANQLVFFDSTGAAFRVAGRRGQGPGELGTVNALALTPDGVAAGEARLGLHRVTFFSAAGEFLRTATAPSTLAASVPRPRAALRLVEAWTGAPLEGPTVLRLLGVLPGERLVTSAIPQGYRAAAGEPRFYAIWSERGELVGELRGPAEPPSPWVVYPGGPSPTPDRLLSVPLGPDCFPGPEQAMLGGVVYVMDPARGRVLAIDPDGASREVYRDPNQGVFTEAIREAVRSRLSTPPADSVEAVLGRLAPAGAPLPSWDGLEVDPTGRLWLRRATCPSTLGPGAPRSYDVIDTAGRQLAVVTIPGFSLLTVRGDRVLMVRRDELRVEHLELYRLLP